jgi:ubiquinone/menaquinone biosynthesis C-methylase UbiE
MREARRTYLPAAGHAWFLPFYDPLVRLLGGESARRGLLDRAELRSGHHVLDIGCGTGSLAVLTKRHLEPGEKESTLCEVRRVLKPGGSLHMLDFGGSETSRHGFLGHLLHSSHRLKDNSESRILALMSQARFSDARKVGQQTMLFWKIAYYQACVGVSDGT